MGAGRGFRGVGQDRAEVHRDVDVAVLVESDGAAEQLVRSLTADGYGLSALVEQDAVGRLATVRLISPGADGVGVVVDLIFATVGIEAEIVADAEVLEILPAVSMPVATVGHLAALKLLARDDETRPQDAADLRALAPQLLAAQAAEHRYFYGLPLAAGIVALCCQDAARRCRKGRWVSRPKHSNKELEAILRSLEAQGWRVTRGKGYYKAYCPPPHACCVKTVKLTPSGSRYALNLRGWLKRSGCWKEEL